MARQIAIPGLARLCIVDRPGEIIALSNHPGLLRGGEVIGPPLNRYVLGNIRRAMRYGDRVLPAALPRDDAARAARQQELAARLDPARIDWSAVPVAPLAAYVKGDLSIPLGPYCQLAAGRVFSPDYRATRSTWAAARTLDRAVRSINPLTHLALTLTGRLRRAQRCLFEAAKSDTFCMHATGIAVHTLAEAVERLRLALSDPETRRHGTIGQILGGAVLGPESVVRHTRRFIDDLPGLTLKPGTLVLLRTQAAGELTIDPRVDFLSKSWSACPADRFVLALVARIWHEVTGEAPPHIPQYVTAESQPA